MTGLNPPLIEKMLEDCDAERTARNSTLTAWEKELKVFPQLLKAARAALGWSQKDLATRCGFSPQVINYFESWKGTPNKVHKKKILQILEREGVEFVSYIHNGEECAGIAFQGGIVGISVDKLFEQRLRMKDAN